MQITQDQISRYDTPSADYLSNGYWMGVIYGEQDAADRKYMMAWDTGDVQDADDVVAAVEARIGEMVDDGQNRPSHAYFYNHDNTIQLVDENDIA